MHGPITSFGGLRSYLGAQVNAYQKMAKLFQEAVEKDAEANSTHHQQYWLSWYGVEFIVASTKAHQARAMLAQLPSYSDEEPLTEHYKRGVMNRLLRLDTRIDSRGSLASARYAEDAEKAFWLELARTIEGK